MGRQIRTLSESPQNIRRRWRRWIARTGEEVGEVLLDDFVFRKSMDSLHRSGRITTHNICYNWLVETYFSACFMSIRRLVDTGKDTYSLRILLKELIERHDLLTRRSFVSAYHARTRHLPGALQVANEVFDDLAGIGAASYPLSGLEKDLKLLDRESSRLAKLATMYQAHSIRDRLQRKGVPRRYFGQELHDAISTIEKLCLKYFVLLCQEDAASLLPGNLPDFDEDFEVMWGQAPG